MKRFEHTLPAYKEARQTYTSLSVAIGIPVGLTFIAGVISGILAGSIAWYFDVRYPLRIAAIVGSVAGLLALGNAIFWWREMLLGVESTMAAMNNPSIYMNPIKIEHIEDKGRVSKYSKLPGTQSQHLLVARHVVSGGKLNFRTLHAFYTQLEAQEYMNALLKHGYVEDRNPNNPSSGVRVTEKGMLMFEASIRQLATTPLPQTHEYISSNPFALTHTTHTAGGDEEEGFDE